MDQFDLLVELDELNLDLPDDSLLPTIGQIASNIGNTPHTLSDKIKRLEKKGLVEKLNDPNDLRITRIALSAKGRTLLDEISQEANNNLIDKALSELSDSALNSFLECLNQLFEHLKEME